MEKYIIIIFLSIFYLGGSLDSYANSNKQSQSIVSKDEAVKKGIDAELYDKLLRLSEEGDEDAKVLLQSLSTDKSRPFDSDDDIDGYFIPVEGHNPNGIKINNSNDEYQQGQDKETGSDNPIIIMIIGVVIGGGLVFIIISNRKDNDDQRI